MKIQSSQLAFLGRVIRLGWVLSALLSFASTHSPWGLTALAAQPGSDRTVRGSNPQDLPPNQDGKSSTRTAENTLDESRYLFGVLNDKEDHYADEYARGVRATNLELHWMRYEPEEGVYDWAYIRELQARMRALKQAGWYVQLVPGLQYAPGWIYDTYPGMFYVNQYGEAYNPDPVSEADFRVINAVFNPRARALIGGYLEHIFTQAFPQTDPELAFDSVRIGAGPQGELRYPPADWNGHSNSYWAFDAAAQDPAQSLIPPEIIGWRPGIDPNPGSLDRGQLLVNPGFEAFHPRLPVFGWTPDEEAGVYYLEGGAYRGTYALQVSLDGAYRVHQFVRVEPGTTYELGGWFKAGPDGGHARMFAIQYATALQQVSGAPFVKLESADAGWQTQSGSLTTAPGTHFLKIELDGDRPGNFYFDELWLQQRGEIDARDRTLEVPTAFYDWYVRSLSAYQNWQIAEVRRYFSGQLDLIYAGKGLLDRQVMAALANDLQGDGWSESSSALYAGTDYARLTAALPEDPALRLYVTGIEAESPDQVRDEGPYPGRWSAARWMAELGRRHGLPVWGENSGRNTTAEMWLAAERMHANGFVGLMWGFESQLYGGSSFATIADYQAVIRYYSGLHEISLPLLLFERPSRTRLRGS